jgi:tRNA pseudouridine55 synthase
MTSHDVVNTLRRLTGERRIGHAGTLDPLATGLLLVCVGPATRLAPYLMGGTKVYEARICFGSATTTDDAEGEIICTRELPPEVGDAAFATRFLEELSGTLRQVPPAYSALKRNGVTAYKAARAGEALELEPRLVQLYEARLTGCGHDYWDVRITTSKGFYVRSFARDVGEQLGTAAHLGALRRQASGTVTLAQAVPLADLWDKRDEDTGGRRGTEDKPLPFIDPVRALGFPAVELDAAQAELVKNGSALTLRAAQLSDYSQKSGRVQSSPALLPPEQQSLVSIVYEHTLLALYEVAASTGFARSKVVIPGGVGSGG